MTWIILFLLVVFFAAIIAGDKSSTPKTKNKSYFPNIKPYSRSKLYFNVKGIWAEPSSITEFRKLHIGDIVLIKFDENNKYDINALGVYSKQGNLLGYIEKNQRKLINSFRENVPYLAKVVDHEEFFSNPRQLMVYRLALEIWIGYPQEELDIEEENFRRLYQSIHVLRNAHSEIKEIRKNITTLKKNDPELTLSKLKLLSMEILENNLNVYDFGKIKIPFLDMIEIAYFNKDYKNVIDIFDQFSTKATITDKQMEEVLKKVEKAHKKIYN